MKCINGLELKVLKSNAGYYIGTQCEDGSPNCRLSNNYWKDKDIAQNCLDRNNFTKRSSSIEIQWCNSGKGCIPTIRRSW